MSDAQGPLGAAMRGALLQMADVPALDSSIGAAGTFVREVGGGAGTLVNIFASDVVLGKLNKGFTPRVPWGTNTEAVTIVTGATGVVVAGNVVLGAVNIGFGVLADGAVLRDNCVLCSTSSGIGFLVLLGTGIRLDRNAVAMPSWVATRASPGRARDWS